MAPDPPLDSSVPPNRPRSSRRISALISRFETTSAVPNAASTQQTGRPLRARSTSSRVLEEVERLSTSPQSGPSLVDSSKSTQQPATSSSGIIAADLDEMGWTPRSPPALIGRPLATKSAAIVPPATPRLGQPTGPLRPLGEAGKAPAAATVLVPAAVSPRNGAQKAQVTVARPERTAFEILEPPRGPAAEKPRDEAARVERSSAVPTPTARSVSKSLAHAPPPPPERPPFAARHDWSIAFAGMAPPERDSFDAADLSPLLSSGASIEKPLRPPLAPSRSTPQKSSSSPPETGPSSRFTASSRLTSASHASTIRCIPAYELFSRDAEPLVLPELDRALEQLGGAAVFSPMPGVSRAAHEEGQNEGGEDEEWELGSLAKGGADGKRDEGDDGVFGSMLEREGWEKWVRDGEPEGRWARILRRISRLVGLQRDALASTPEERVAFSSAAAAAGLTPAQYDRTLKFPPFHLLPRNLTVTDLKANRRKPPPLVSLQSLLTTASNGVLGAAGSSYGIKLTTIEGLRDLMQMFALLITAGSPTLSTLQAGSASSHQPAESTAVRILFVTVPSFLSLDFVAAFGQALVFLFVLTAVTFAALYEFYRFTGGWHGPVGKLGQGKLDLGEGYDREELNARRIPWRDSYAWRVVVTFWCGSVYLPLSRLAIGALAWTDDYWDVPNPYELFSSETPSPPPLGPSSDWFDPMDFCYRTTMRRRSGFKHLNFAYVLLPLAGLIIVILSLWFPWRQHKVVKSEAPTVDGWTELGERRKNHNAEYERLLDVDPSPFNFLYRDYRKRWASFRSIYLLFKLVNVLLVVLIQKNNCLLRTYTTLYLSIVRQGCLLAFMALFCILSAWSSPYLTLISNSSDLVSRVGFVLLALLGLLAALSMPGTDPAVVLTNIVVYGLNIYFALIGTSFMQSIVKKLRRRVDFSVDIFSPDLDLAKHLGRRVWQESLAALFLCSPDLAMAPKQKLAFAQEPGLPPYLLNFSGSPAERFIENLKILREIGLDTYSDAVRSLDTSPDSYIMRLRRLIELQHAGPDMFYKPPDLSLPLASFFGRVDVVPFPFIVVFRFDQNPTQPLHLVEEAELELLVQQNRQPEIVAARKVRLALRALEGQLIFAPHVKVHRLGSTGRTDVERHISYRMARVRIARNSAFLWQGCNVSSGFDVSLQYADGEGPGRDGRMQRGQKLTLAAPDVGIDDTFQLTAKLAALLVRNRTLVDQRLPIVESALQRHRDFFRVEAERKHHVLSHAFLLTVFGENQLSGADLDSVLRSSEENVKVQRLALSYKAAVNRLEQRMEAVTKDSTRGWWYLFWDDLWRRNHNIGLRDRDFSPHYASSICYHPMARKGLELFLQSRGADVGRRAYLHPGFLNRLYFYLDEQMFSSTSHAIPLHLTSSPNAIPFNHLSHAFQHHHTTSTSEHSDPFTRRNASQGTHFTVNTGGGTDEDDPEIRQRAAFIYEEVFERPLPRFRNGSRIAWARFQVQVRAKQWLERFLGLEPCVRDWRPSEDDGVMLDLRWTKGGWRAPPSASAQEKPEQL